LRFESHCLEKRKQQKEKKIKINSTARNEQRKYPQIRNQIFGVVPLSFVTSFMRDNGYPCSIKQTGLEIRPLVGLAEP